MSTSSSQIWVPKNPPEDPIAWPAQVNYGAPCTITNIVELSQNSLRVTLTPAPTKTASGVDGYFSPLNSNNYVMSRVDGGFSPSVVRVAETDDANVFDLFLSTPVKPKYEYSLTAQRIASDGPLDIFTDMAAWWRADLGVRESEGEIVEWRDQSGNNRHFVPYSSSTRPVRVSAISDIDLQPAVYFDGSNALRTVKTMVLGVCTIILVCKYSSAPSGQMLVEHGEGFGTDNTFAFRQVDFYFSNSVALFQQRSGVMCVKYNAAQTADAWHIFRPHCAATYAADAIHVDGSAANNTVTGFNTNQGATTRTEKLYLGSSSGTSDFATMHVFEMIVLPRVLTAPEVTALAAYHAAIVGLP